MCFLPSEIADKIIDFAQPFVNVLGNLELAIGRRERREVTTPPEIMVTLGCREVTISLTGLSVLVSIFESFIGRLPQYNLLSIVPANALILQWFLKNGYLINRLEICETHSDLLCQQAIDYLSKGTVSSGPFIQHLGIHGRNDGFCFDDQMLGQVLQQHGNVLGS